MNQSKSMFSQLFCSSVGRKYVMAVTGLALVGFTITHLIGNLLLLVPDGGEAFNTYAKQLHDLGVLLIVAEVGLVGAFLAHIIAGIQTKLSSNSAREEKYYSGIQTKGGPSKNNAASKNMIIPGMVLLAFIVFHIWHFKLGPGKDEGYSTMIDGEYARNLYLLVVHEFQKLWVVLVYIFSMVMLGFHIRHGFWSAFQSLGIAFPRFSKGIHCIGVLIAFALALGFIAIPLVIYFGDQYS